MSGAIQDIHFAAYLNGARDFCLAADKLLGCHNPAESDGSPIYFLYSHAAELALKSFLTFKGEKTNALKKKWGHDLEKLFADAKGRGLSPPTVEVINFGNVISLLKDGNKNEGFRYFTLKPGNKPDLEWAGKIVNQLLALVEKQTGYTKGPPGPAVAGSIIWSEPVPNTNPKPPVT
jgi:hypothetical protein